MTYFRDLNWIFPVKAKSIFKITVASRGKEVGSTKVDLNHLKSIPFDQFGNREVIFFLTVVHFFLLCVCYDQIPTSPISMFILILFCHILFLQLVLSFADEQGRAAGKVRMIVKLSNVAINEYDASHYDNDALGMDGVSVNGGVFR